MISTRNLEAMPKVSQLRLLWQSLAMLDAILEPEWELRYYSFDALWAKEQQTAWMRDGSGDDYVILFDIDGKTLIKGFAHECAMSPHRCSPPTLWPGVMNDLPLDFDEFFSEPAFASADATFCLWHAPENDAWQRGAIDFPDGEDPDGSAALLAILDGNPETYRQWAQEYYERGLNLSAIERIYRHQPLTKELVFSLNADADLTSVTEDAATIGYPTRLQSEGE